MAELRADGQRVLVTAGASGIGRAIAEVLAEAGARVDVDEAALAGFRRDRPEVGATNADVADDEAVDRLFNDVQTRLGGLDVLVNNAGLAGPTGPIEEIDPAAWRRCLEVGLTGQFLCARRAVPLLKAVGAELSSTCHPWPDGSAMHSGPPIPRRSGA
jgi:NAD(P)-dependent dehydrogenase (short-subunit alcohol dehydrogenase family)